MVWTFIITMWCGIVWWQLPRDDGEELVLEMKWEDRQDCSSGLGRTQEREYVVTVAWGGP